MRLVKYVQRKSSHYCHELEPLLGLVSHQLLNFVVFYIFFHKRFSYEFFADWEVLVEVEPVSRLKLSLKLLVRQLEWFFRLQNCESRLL